MNPKTRQPHAAAEILLRIIEKDFDVDNDTRITKEFAAAVEALDFELKIYARRKASRKVST